jgi:hypothetical protein
MTDADTDKIGQIEQLTGQIRPLLAGKDPMVQSAVLADLLAMWLAGHFVQGDRDETRKLRADLLRMHLETVERLTEINAMQMGTNR